MVLYPGHGCAQSRAETTSSKFVCGQAATPISAVQGNGPSSGMVGDVVEIEAVVVRVFQNPGELGGLFIQEEDTDQDRDAGTSEGLFALTSFPARSGDLVRLRGTVAEFRGLTELYPVTRLRVCSNARPLPAPALVQLPVKSMASFEALENMRVRLPQTLVVTALHQLWQYGELVVSSKRLAQSTEMVTPGKAAAKLEEANGHDQLVIDDGRTGRFLPVAFRGQDNASPFSAGNPLRNGQEISHLEGVMHYGFGHYRLQVTGPFAVEAEANPRTPVPDSVGGTLRVSVFNVLSYFSTLDSSGAVCGPSRQKACRGARDQPEQKRQIKKLTAALSAIDSDIQALVELENNPQQSLRDITDALNSIAGDETWSYVPSGSIGQDAIKVGLLFKPAVVTTAGRFAILNRAVDARFNDTLNRPALAQSFSTAGGGLITVIVAHLKSRNCSGAKGADTDQGDKQACYNRTRTNAAAALADWAVSDPTGTGGQQVLVVGDFNSYRMEDPVRMMRRKTLVDLQDRFHAASAYTYVYDGRAGTLDYAFGSPGLAAQMTGMTVWHINADESSALDYRDRPGKPGAYHDAGPFRSSDHDPLIIGLDPGPARAAAGQKIRNEDSSALRYTHLPVTLLLLIIGAYMLRRRRPGSVNRPTILNRTSG